MQHSRRPRSGAAPLLHALLHAPPLIVGPVRLSKIYWRDESHNDYGTILCIASLARGHNQVLCRHCQDPTVSLLSLTTSSV
jgi:hypothetical protein